jgi:DNA-binding NtrC family response regulator
MPHVDGETLLKKIHDTDLDIPIVIVTGTVDVETAVRCMKSGAFDYIMKPIDDGQLITAVNRAISFRDLKRENKALRKRILSEEPENPEAFSEIITRNRKMYAIFRYVESIAKTLQPVLIRGETGVGKELVARAVHRLSGVTGEFVAINVAGLDDNVFSDTLFGHVKGAFTGADTNRPGLIEKAYKGTLFLDEIGDLTMASQVKLLRLLQEKEYFPLGKDETKKAEVRIIASTNRSLWKLMQQDRFRKDLIYRLQTHRIEIPPLRQRTDDLPLLFEYFLKKCAEHLKTNVPNVSEDVFSRLETYDFPGNIRELQGMIFDALSRERGGTISWETLKNWTDRVGKAKDSPGREENYDSGVSVVFPGELPTLKEASRLLVEEALKRAQGNQSVAARLLGITQQALSKRLKSYDT